MRNGKYLISQAAIEDLNGVWRYTFENWSKEQADRYYKLIIDEIEFVAANFSLGKSIDQLRNNYKVSKVKSHLIYYRKIDNELVQIVRILHQSMYVKRHLE